MIDITHKPVTLRIAKAQGKVVCRGETIRRIKEDNLPKGNLFEIAKAAGLLASKNAANMIPHCHPVSIDYMDVSFKTGDREITILATGKSISRTGIEMEVLAAVTAAALTIYDLLKPIDKEMEITNIKLLEKKGGKSNHKRDPGKGLEACILVSSDTATRDNDKDLSGKKIRAILGKFNIKIKDFLIVPDDKNTIRKNLHLWIDKDVPFIFTTGGTGLGPRDITAEAVEEIIEKKIPGIAEAMRSHGQMRTPRAMLSRSVAGLVRQSVIITLPGSLKGVEESLDAILPSVFHARKMILGEGHDE